MSTQRFALLDDRWRSPRPRTRRGRVVTVGIIVFAIVVAALVARTIASNQVRYTGSAGNLTGGPATVAKTVYTAPMLMPAGGDSAKTSTELVSAQPIVTENSADADVRVLICTYNGQTVWNLTTDPFQFCSSVRPFEPGRQTIGQPSDDGTTTLILAITPYRPGTVHINGIHTGYRHGSLTNGINIDLRAEH